MGEKNGREHDVKAMFLQTKGNTTSPTREGDKGIKRNARCLQPSKETYIKWVWNLAMMCIFHTNNMQK